LVWHLAIFAAGILVPTFALVVALLWQFVTREEARMEQQARDIARAMASDVDRDLSAEIVVLRTLATSPLLRSGDFERFRVLAEDTARILEVEVAVCDPSGRLLLDTRAGAAASPSQGRLTDTVRHALAERDPVVSGVYVGEDQQPVISIYLPVLQDGKLLFLLSLEKSAARVRDIVLQAGFPTDWRGSIIDASHNIIARGTLQEECAGKSSSPAFSAHVIGDSGGWRGKNLEGIELVSAYARSPISGWVGRTASIWPAGRRWPTAAATISTGFRPGSASK